MTTQPSSPLSSLSPSQLSAMGSAMEALGGSLSGLQRAPLGDQRTAVDYVKGVTGLNERFMSWRVPEGIAGRERQLQLAVPGRNRGGSS